MQPALAKVMSVATGYITTDYRRAPPKLLFIMSGRATETTPSARGVQQGYNLDFLYYSIGSLNNLREFRTDQSVHTWGLRYHRLQSSCTWTRVHCRLSTRVTCSPRTPVVAGPCQSAHSHLKGVAEITTEGQLRDTMSA